MTPPRPVENSVFTIERKRATTPRHAFRFWSDSDLKARWINCHPDGTVLEDTFDFRVRGSNRMHWRTGDGQDQTFAAYCLDVVPAPDPLRLRDVLRRCAALRVTSDDPPDALGR